MDFLCEECLNPKIEAFCCCSQIQLCKDCLNTHKGQNHYLIKNPKDLFSSYDSENDAENKLSYFIKFADKMIFQLETLDLYKNTLIIDNDLFKEFFPEPVVTNFYHLQAFDKILEINPKTMETQTFDRYIYNLNEC